MEKPRKLTPLHTVNCATKAKCGLSSYGKFAAWTGKRFPIIHNNPVTAGIGSYPEQYKYSSAKFYETGEDEFGILTHWVA